MIEVVVERLDIKQQVYEKVEQFRKPGTLITSNTSGIPIHMLTEGQKRRFSKNIFAERTSLIRHVICVCLEIIPTPETDKGVIDFLMHYGDVVSWEKQPCLQKIRLHLLPIALVCLALWPSFNTWKNLDLTH